METYLLEKSRVVFVAPGERSYHAFYMLQARAKTLCRTRFHHRSRAQHRVCKHADRSAA